MICTIFNRLFGSTFTQTPSNNHKFNTCIPNHWNCRNTAKNRKHANRDSSTW